MNQFEKPQPAPKPCPTADELPTMAELLEEEERLYGPPCPSQRDPEAKLYPRDVHVTEVIKYFDVTASDYFKKYGFADGTDPLIKYVAQAHIEQAAYVFNQAFADAGLPITAVIQEINSAHNEVRLSLQDSTTGAYLEADTITQFEKIVQAVDAELDWTDYGFALVKVDSNQ